MAHFLKNAMPNLFINGLLHSVKNFDNWLHRIGPTQFFV